MTATYTVIDHNSGEPLDRHLTAAEAAHIILTDDGRDYDIRPDEDSGWALWARQQVANRGWERTVVYSIDDDRERAEAEIWQKVIDARWPRHPEAMTDDQYARMLTSLSDIEA